VALTGKMSQIRSDLRQNAKIHDNGSNLRILRIPWRPQKIYSFSYYTFMRPEVTYLRVTTHSNCSQRDWMRVFVSVIVSEVSEADCLRLQLMEILIKVADISNEMRPLSVATPWLDCLLAEFFNQVSVSPPTWAEPRGQTTNVARGPLSWPCICCCWVRWLCLLTRYTLFPL